MSNIQHIIDGDTGQEAANKINAVIDETNGLDARFDAKYDANNPDGFVDAQGAANAAPVQSVNSQTGVVQIDKSDVGLSEVDNTSDADKPISNATQAALDGKEDAGLNAVALGDIDGAVAIDLSQGSTFTGNLTDAITLSFTNVPTGGSGIVLEFTGIEQITFPVGGNAVGGDIPEATGGRYKYILTVRASGDYDVDGLIDDIQSV